MAKSAKVEGSGTGVVENWMESKIKLFGPDKWNDVKDNVTS